MALDTSVDLFCCLQGEIKPIKWVPGKFKGETYLIVVARALLLGGQLRPTNWATWIAGSRSWAKCMIVIIESRLNESISKIFVAIITNLAFCRIKKDENSQPSWGLWPIILG